MTRQRILADSNRITICLEPFFGVCVKQGRLMELVNVEGCVHNVRTPDLEERVLQDIANNPSVSSRQVARQYNVNQRLVLNILHDNN